MSRKAVSGVIKMIACFQGKLSSAREIISQTGVCFIRQRPNRVLRYI